MAWCLGGLGRGHRAQEDSVIVAHGCHALTGRGRLGGARAGVGLRSISPERLRVGCVWIGAGASGINTGHGTL